MPALAWQPGRQVRCGGGIGVREAEVETSTFRCLGKSASTVAQGSIWFRRDFIQKRYVELKKANPDLPILIRECSDVQPKLWARYGECGAIGV